jgi:hypothetical protein
MKKTVGIFSFLIVLVLAIPVFRSLCERFNQCEIMRVYSILTDEELALQALV